MPTSRPLQREKLNREFFKEFTKVPTGVSFKHLLNREHKIILPLLSSNYSWDENRGHPAERRARKDGKLILNKV